MILRDKVAIVTGSSRGIGAATAKLLAAHGAKVAVNYAQSREKGEKVVEEIVRAGGKAILAHADVTEREDVEAMLEKTEAALGPVDILVINASIHFPVTPFVQYKWEDFEKKVLGEMKALYHPCQAVVPGMVQRGAGCIVTISSGLSRVPGPGFVAHSTAKSALDGFSKSLALELGPRGIRVNVVAPGATDTDAIAFMSKEMRERVAAHTPLRRFGQAEDVAGAVLFYCADWSRFITGTYLPVCGGSQMS
ncbi:MAG: SDR family NAD(P)-dependent oxidoreductase [Polyangia bacterium]|jgi:3-oxoacyl-[acyl-carrier protein] reductase